MPLALLGVGALDLGAAAAGDFELVNGDRIILLGSTFVEREAQSGYLETLLTSHYPGRNLVFRNLGWSGDTVWAEARAGFDTPSDGFKRLAEQVRSLSPTCIFVAYGANEAFAGPAGLDGFVAGLNKLLDTLAETKARIVLVAPPRQEDFGPPLPDPAAHNENLRVYAEAIRGVAAQRGGLYLDLYELLPDGMRASPPCPLTDNGLHFTAYGYWRAATAFQPALGLPLCDWAVELTSAGEVVTQHRTAVSAIEVSDDGIRFTAHDRQLPLPPPPACSAMAEERPTSPAPRVLRVAGLPEGRYLLTIDNQEVATGTGSEWRAGVAIKRGPEFDQVEQLRRTIGCKNELYFHRWRPQNDTYLFGFRKHEQGQNAIEVPQFDPLVAEQEAIVARLRVPASHRYQLVRKVRPPVEPQASN